MELIVTRADNSNYNLPSENSKITSAVQTRTLMGEDTVAMTVQSVGYINFLIGDWIEVFGRKYTLNTLGEPQRIGENTFEYNLVFEGVNYELTKVVYRSADYSGFNPTSDFPLTGTAESFLTVLQYNLDRTFGQGIWAIGSFPATEAKTLSFTSENCLLALNRVCSEFGLEYEIKIIGGVKTINLGAVGDTLSLTLEYGKGKGLYSLTRTNVDSKNIVTRLYVEGSDRNVKAGYRDNAIRLRIAANAESYIDSPSVASFGVIEGSKIFEDIFPHREGTVSAINASDILEFTDSSMDFDLAETDTNGTKWLIAGQSAKIHFNTGALAGYEFELTAYNHTTKTFKIKPFKDERGLQFPNPDSAAFQIKTGDKYVILDIIMPDSYIQAAEAELLARAQEYLSQNDQPRVEYALELDRFFLKSMFSGPGFEVNFLDAGDYLHIKDSKIGVDKEVRVKTFTRDVIDPWVYQVALSDVIEPTRIELLLADTLETKKAARQSKLFDPARSRRNWRDVEEVAGMVDTLRAEVALIGSPEGQFQVDSFFEVNKGGNPDSFGATAGVLAHDAFEGDAGSIWNIGAFDVALSNSGAYYLYAQCSKANTGAVFTVSLTKIGVEDVGGYYHFPVGLISSKRDNSRTLTTTYGYTLISGNNISTGIIKNENSGIMINLETGDIQGKFTFRSGRDVEEVVEEVADSVDAVQVGGRNLIPNSIGLLRGLTVYSASGYAKENVEGGVKLTFEAGDTVRGVSREYVNNSSTLSGVELSGFVTTSMIIESDEPFSGFRVSLFTSSLGHLHVNGTVTEVAPNKYRCAATTELTEPRTGVRCVDFYLNANANCTYLTVRNIKLELGNRATDWTPAPEDVDAGIAAAKQEALTAAGNAQSTANSANTAVGNLSGYVDGAFKDGVIDTAEAKAIEKYKNSLAETKLSVDGAYTQLYNSTYLEGSAKSNLSSAKGALNSAYTSLVTSIDNAIADGKTTAAEKTDVDSKFGLFNTAMATYQVRAEEANRAIQVKLDNISKGYADAVQVGGRNLLDKTNQGSDGWGWRLGTSGASATVESVVEDGVNTVKLTRNTVENSSWSFIQYNYIGREKYKPNTRYTLSFFVKSSVNTYFTGARLQRANGQEPIIVFGQVQIQAVAGEWSKMVFTGTSVEPLPSATDQVVYLSGMDNSPGITYQIKDLKVELGNRATDWTPAPEDVPSALDYLAKAIQGSTEIDGGLTMTNLLLLKNLAGQITGGMSGLDGDNVLLFGGGDYQAALDSAVQTLIRKDGTGLLGGGIVQWNLAGMKVGDLDIHKSGAVLLRDSGVLKLLITRETIMSPEALIGGGQSSETSFTSTTNAATGVAEVTKGTYTIKNNGTEVTVTTTLSALVQLSQSHGYSTATIQIIASYPSSGNRYVISSYSLSASGTTDERTGSRSVNATSILPAGTMNLVVRFENVNNVPGAPAGFVCSASAGTIDIFHSASNPHSEIGKNGFMFGKDSYNFAYFGVDNSSKFRVILRSEGDFDLPGVLLSGYINTSGQMTSYWGAKFRSGTYRISTGNYRINHSIGHSAYRVLLTANGLPAIGWVKTKTNTYVDVEFRDTNNSVIDSHFDIAIIGNNF